MDFRARADLISAAGWRLLFLAVLVALILQVLATTRHFVSASLLAAAVGLVLLDLARLAGRSSPSAVATPSQERARAQETDQALALIDAVTVSLLTLSGDGRIRFANRAGRALTGGAARLEDIGSFGTDAAAAILALPIGGRQLVSLADGRSMLVWVGSFSTPEGGSQRLVSLQAVTGELDAVQVGAWHAMTRVLAHEMMNSLAPIASLSESLMRLSGDARPEVAAAAETIARQSRHLMSFVERYRAIVNLPEPEPVPIDLAAFVADLDALAGAQLRDRGISFAAAPATGFARGDPGLLGQALLNLILNAADAASGVEAPEVRLTCSRAAGSLRFEVVDNGIGVSADRIEEIFVPFFTTKEEGAGVGLTLARQVALAHGGRLTAGRNAGPGMTFTLAIPA
jgi:signal transduction histidine kinase